MTSGRDFVPPRAPGPDMTLLTANAAAFAPAFALTDLQAIAAFHFGLHGELTPR